MTKIPVTTPFTVEEFKEKLSKWQDDHFDGKDIFLYYWYEDVSEEDDPDLPGIGRVVEVDRDGGEGDGAEISIVVEVGGRYFRKTGYYSSWGDSEMDGAIEEVFPREVTRTEYFTEKE